MTRMIHFTLILWLISSLTVLSNDIKDCNSLGFQREKLHCKVCNDLETYMMKYIDTKYKTSDKMQENAVIMIQEMINDCQSCCLEAMDPEFTIDDEDQIKYDSVVLETGPRMLRFHPTVGHFISSYQSKFKDQLSIKYIQHQIPQFVFFNQDNEERLEEISIAHWKEESIVEYLQTKLKDLKDVSEEHQEL